jgi:hypothetical protein
MRVLKALSPRENLAGNALTDFCERSTRMALPPDCNDDAGNSVPGCIPGVSLQSPASLPHAHRARTGNWFAGIEKSTNNWDSPSSPQKQ